MPDERRLPIADDFPAIRARVAELAAERAAETAPVSAPSSQPVCACQPDPRTVTGFDRSACPLHRPGAPVGDADGA